MRQSTSLTLKQLPMPIARKQIAQYTKQELLRFKISDGTKMAALVKQEYKSGKLKEQRKIADRLPHHKSTRTKNNDIIERNKILILSAIIKNNTPMTNRQIGAAINLTQPSGQHVNKNQISGAVTSLENAGKLEKAAWVKCDTKRCDLVAAYQLVTK